MSVMSVQDWKECRTTIGRLDTILVDLRKVGFSIITGLLTAGAFLNFLGIPTTQGVPAPTTDVSAAVFITVMVLVAALFSVDTYYQVLLSGAVERALDLEAEMRPPIRVTKYLSVNATRSGTSFIILALYIVLLLTAEGMGLFAAKGMNNLAFSWRNTCGWIPIVGIGIFVGGIIVALIAYLISDAKPHWLLITVIIGVLPLLTIILAIFLLSSPIPDPLGVQHWIVAAGMFLVMYIQFYWLCAAWRSGLYRHKPSRKWPEGDGKV